MQYPPSVDHVKRSLSDQVRLVQGGAALNLPFRVFHEIGVLQLNRARDGLRIVVEGENPGSEPSSGEAEDPTSTANVQERLLIEILD